MRCVVALVLVVTPTALADPRAESHANTARLAASRGHCTAARMHAEKVRELDAAYYRANLETDPAIAACMPKPEPSTPEIRAGLEVILDAHLCWQGRADGNEGGPAAYVSVGKRDGWGGQLVWRFAQYREYGMPGDDSEFDTSANFFGPGIVRRWAIDPWSFSSLGAGVALNRRWITEEPCVGPACGADESPRLEWRFGAYIDARLGVDLIKLDRFQAIHASVAVGIALVQPGAVVASAGIGYHYR